MTERNDVGYLFKTEQNIKKSLEDLDSFKWNDDRANVDYALTNLKNMQNHLSDALINLFKFIGEYEIATRKEPWSISLSDNTPAYTEEDYYKSQAVDCDGFECDDNVEHKNVSASSADAIYFQDL